MGTTETKAPTRDEAERLCKANGARLGHRFADDSGSKWSRCIDCGTRAWSGTTCGTGMAYYLPKREGRHPYRPPCPGLARE